MSQWKDYYKILGVARTATASKIKEAYRNLAMEYHPDKHPDNPLAGLAEEKFKDISEAYEVLGDQYKRRQYDSAQGYAGTSNNYQRDDYSKQSSKSSQSDFNKGAEAATKKAKNRYTAIT